MAHRLKPDDKEALDLILKDLELLFSNEILENNIDMVVEQLKSDEVRAYVNHLRNGSKPEVALREAFFAGKSLLLKYLAVETSPEVNLGDGFVDYLISINGRTILLELKPLFEADIAQTKARRELKALKQKPLTWENHKMQILKYISDASRRGVEYVILTNLKEWRFFNKECSHNQCVPFHSVDLSSFLKGLEGHNLYEYLERHDLESSRGELDKRFFASLKAWVDKFSEVEFCVDDKRKLELIINLINRFVFIQTLDDYGVIEFRWIKHTWDHVVQRWSAKGRLQVLKEFFREVTEWFYEYYDTELFRDDVLKYIKDESVNIDKFYRNLELVLGLAYYNTQLGGFKGIMQYKFKFINEDILGKAYETFLADVRKEQGIYYTPPYVTEYIVNQSIGRVLDDIMREIDKAVREEDFESVRKLVERFINIKVLDPACGSGSFLIKALKKFFSSYDNLHKLLENTIKKYTQSNETLDQWKKEEVKVLMEIQELVSSNSKRELIAKILIRHIYGNDLDPKALEVAKINLWLEAIKLAPIEFRFDRLPNKTNHILPDLEMNLGNGDSLFSLSFKTVIDLLSRKYLNELRTMSQLRNEYLKDPTRADLVQRISQLKNKIKETLMDTLTRQVYKSCTLPDQLKLTSPFFWPLEFWFVFFNDQGEPLTKEERGFDIVIGNPPYYTETRGYKEKFRLYACSPLVMQYYESKMDIFYFFIELGLDLLRPKGKLGFIIMQYWSSRGSGKILRQKIMNEAIITTIVNFNEFRVFEEAKGQHNSVLVLTKETPPSNTYNITTIEVMNATAPKEEVISVLSKGHFTENVSMRTLCVVYDTNLGKIAFIPKEYMEIVQKIMSQSNYRIPVERISQGVVLPQDKVTAEQIKKIPTLKKGEGIFLLSGEEVKSMTLTAQERSLIQPFYWARQLDSFYYEDEPAGWLIYTEKKYIDYDEAEVNKRSIAEGKKKEDVQREILTEVHKKYPAITEHLDRFRDVITSDRWPYGIHRSRRKEIFFNEKKIISVRKTQYPKFVWVPLTYFMDESVNYIEPDEAINPSYLVALFNSSLMWFWFRYGIQKTHGTQLQIDIEIIKNAPLIKPPNNDIEILLTNLSQNMYNLKKSKQAYIRLWQMNSKQMSNASKTLYEILKEDIRNLREGRFEDCWTSKASFYPKDFVSSKEKFEYFVVELDDSTIKIHGVDEGGRLSTVYEMTFSNKDLMTHVYCALLSSDISRYKTLSELLQNIKIPVIKPNSAKQTRNIISKVANDFLSYLAREKLNVPTELAEIDNKLMETMAQIDACVFALYCLAPVEVKTVLNSLELTVRYRQKVLGSN